MTRYVYCLMILVLLAGWTAAAPAVAQQFSLRAGQFSMGGVQTLGAEFSLQSSVGSQLGGRGFGEGLSLRTGFWHQLKPATGPLALAIANDDFVTTDEDTPTHIDVLANDAGPIGDSLRIVGLTKPGNGASLIEDGAIRYTPERDFFGDDEFTYTIQGSIGGTTSASVRITVNARNDEPRFKSTPPAAAVAGSVYAYAIEVEDVDNDSLEIKAALLPGWLNLQDNGDGTADLMGTPGSADVGKHSVTLTASDGELTPQQTFSIEVAAGGLATPQLVAPEDNSVVKTDTVQLSWNPLPGATAYDLQVDDNAEFTSPIEAEGLRRTEIDLTGLTGGITIFWRVRAIDVNGVGPYSTIFQFTTATNVATEEESLPTEFALHPNYPNPFNPSTTIPYQLPQTSRVRLTVYDLFGREVAKLVDETQAAGQHKVVFESSGLPSGTYFYQLEAGTWTNVRQFVLLK